MASFMREQKRNYFQWNFIQLKDNKRRELIPNELRAILKLNLTVVTWLYDLYNDSRKPSANYTSTNNIKKVENTELKFALLSIPINHIVYPAF